MNSYKLYLSFLIFSGLPPTRLFNFKNWLLRWSGAKIGENVRICSSVRIQGTSRLEIGDDTWIGHQTFILCSAPVKIGSHVDIAPQVYIGTGTHQVDKEGLHSAGEGVSKPIVIDDGAWLGARSVVMPGITIGKKSVLGAGTLVLADVPEMVVVVGIPGRILRSL
jgi:putative colanic acid biosynthesis acetyltransferase WcaF